MPTTPTYIVPQTPCKFEQNFRSIKTLCPGRCGSVDWVPPCGLKGHWFNCRSGHMPGLQAWSPVWGVQEATGLCFSRTLMSLSFFHPLFPSLQKINTKKICKDFKHRPVASCSRPYQDWTHNPGMSPHLESKQWHFALQNDIKPSELHWSGLLFHFSPINTFWTSDLKNFNKFVLFQPTKFLNSSNMAHTDFGTSDWSAATTHT